MELNKLLNGIEVVEVIGDGTVDIKDLKCDSNAVSDGSLFFCLTGRVSDGNKYIKQAKNYGAVAIVTEKKSNVNLTQVIVKNARQTMAKMASQFFDNPDKKLKIIGVVGTNGKTTTANMTYSVLNSAGFKTGVIGTLGVKFCDKEYPPTLTTPDPIDLYRILGEMADCGVEYAVMEVSAHAIYLDKVKDLNFYAGVFTNFSQDHLDFFGDMKTYKQAKLKFFRENQMKYAVINSDDEVGREITTFLPKAITYGLDNPSDVFALEIKCNSDNSTFVINLFDCIYRVKINMVGRFNVLNALAVSSVSALAGVETDAVIDGIKQFNGIEGRLEKIVDKGITVYIDYAHTPDGLEKVLSTLKPLCTGKLISVFGCGGNRDSDKRRKMGAISGKIADFTVITTDNPRYEEPMEIIAEIEKGVLKHTKNYVLVENRKDGIEYAVNYAKSGDVILIAGKGGEKYQEILGIKHLYNDKDTVEELLRGKEN